MRKWAILSLVIVLAFGAHLGADDKNDKAKEDKQKIQGAWKLMSFEVAGKGDDDTKDENRELIIEGDKISVKNDGKDIEKDSFTLDPAKEPKVIDLITLSGNDKDKKRPGIYELDGDNLKICIDEKGEKRPTAFATKEGDGLVLVVLKRVKK